MLGYSLGTTRRERPHLLRPIAEQVLPYLAQGRLQMKIGGRFALKDAAQAQEFVESRKSTGKVLLVVSG